MRKELAIAVVCLFVISGLVGLTTAIQPSGNGYDENGFNWKSRVWNGWDPNNPYAWETWKWTKDWKWDMATVTSNPWTLQPDDDETAIGAWLLINWQWYSNIPEDDSYNWDSYFNAIQWDGHVAPDADYQIKLYCKVMKMGNDYDAWMDYYDAGGWYWYSFDEFYYYDNYNVGGTQGVFDFDYDVPKYIWLQYHLNVYERHWSVLGMWTLTNHVTVGDPGDYTHDVVIDYEDPATGDFTGYGNYPHDDTYFIHWHCEGNAVGTDFEMTIYYQTINGNPSSVELYYDGYLDTSDGHIEGDLDSNIGVSGWFETSDWTANPYYAMYAEYDLIGMPPFGLGQPLW